MRASRHLLGPHLGQRGARQDQERAEYLECRERFAQQDHPDRSRHDRFDRRHDRRLPGVQALEPCEEEELTEALRPLLPFYKTLPPVPPAGT